MTDEEDLDVFRYADLHYKIKNNKDCDDQIKTLKECSNKNIVKVHDQMMFEEDLKVFDKDELEDFFIICENIAP